MVINLTFSIFILFCILENSNPIEYKGSFAELGEFPYVVLLLVNGMKCTGGLLEPDWIITAAHCLFDFKQNKIYVPEDVNIYAGVIDELNLDVPSKQSSNGLSIHIHPDYDYKGEQVSIYDIALVKIPMDEIDLPQARRRLRFLFR
uniref:Peptidase S1 domain-containing protein n=1 Tax=Clastoptera arizonana TaxID=38151 RepID=A0A1B6BXX0_9HEMI